MALFKLFFLVVSFLLYVVDLGMDVYVAVQHYKNGDMLFFAITYTVVVLSTIIVNIYATSVLKATTVLEPIPLYLRTFLCISHLSMIYLFIREIRRCVKENYSEKAHPCNGRNHFSECICSQCKVQLKESVQASLNMSFVRSMETFIESVPQCLLQVYIMIYKQSYPSYVITSVIISFTTLLYSVLMHERNYWIHKIVMDRPSINPVSFPMKSTVVFILWQSFLLLGRLSAFILSVIVFSGSLISSILYGVECGIIEAYVFLFAVRNATENNGIWMSYSVIMFLASPFMIYPLIFHVSHSSVACFEKFTPYDYRKSFKAVAVILVPIVFLVFHCVGGVFAIVVNGEDAFLIWYIAIGCVYVLAFIFEAIYYFCWSPLTCIDQTAQAT